MHIISLPRRTIWQLTVDSLFKSIFKDGNAKHLVVPACKCEDLLLLFVIYEGELKIFSALSQKQERFLTQPVDSLRKYSTDYENS